MKMKAFFATEQMYFANEEKYASSYAIFINCYNLICPALGKQIEFHSLMKEASKKTCQFLKLSIQLDCSFKTTSSQRRFVNIDVLLM